MPDTSPSALLSTLRPQNLSLPRSGIMEVVNFGRTKPGLLPLWVGEGDASTPEYIRAAAIESLKQGETFYTYQGGIPPLRAAIALYMQNVYGQNFSEKQFFVTGSGMQAMQICVNLLAGNGDEVIVPTPAWPNFAGALAVAGAKPISVAMDYSENGWYLDIEKLTAAVSPRTKALVVNSPSNPTGWTASLQELQELLAFARKHQLWIIADEIYGRFCATAPRAPSFHDIMSDEDKILFINTFSKNWAMTGWRLGWIELSQRHVPEMASIVESLIQYSTSGAPTFVQKAGIAALEKGDDFILEQVARSNQNRSLLMKALGAWPSASYAAPGGAFYMFFRLDKGKATTKTSREMAFALINEANLGLAPGTAFGPGGDGFLRLCYLRKTADIQEAIHRLAAALPSL